MSVGILTLNRFNGQEQFSISKAIIFQYKDENRLMLSFEIETNQSSVKTLPDTKEFPAQPSAEFNVSVTNFAWENLAGKSFVIPHGYDEETEEWLARFYYYEHQYIDQNEIKVIKHDGDKFHVIITGISNDINYYDGSKPRTEIEIDAWFEAKQN